MKRWRSRLSAWLTAGWVTPSLSAAREALRSETRASKATSRLRSILRRFMDYECCLYKYDNNEIALIGKARQNEPNKRVQALPCTFGRFRC